MRRVAGSGGSRSPVATARAADSMPSSPAIAARAPALRARPSGSSVAAWFASVRCDRMLAPSWAGSGSFGRASPSSADCASASAAASRRRSAATSVSQATARENRALTRAAQMTPSRMAATRSSVASSAPFGASMPDTAMMPTV